MTLIFSSEYRIGMEDCGRYNRATNRALLAILEDIACFHSSSVGVGLKEIDITGHAWVVLNWRMDVLRRPEYKEILTASTWSTVTNKLCVERDFEIKDEEGKVITVGSSRWIYMDLKRRRPVRLTEEFIERYHSEPDRRSYPESEWKLDVPDGDYIEAPYTILRRDVDNLGHMHNICYLDSAYDVIPEDIYQSTDFNKVQIEYRKELLKEDKVTTKFYKIEDGCIITMNTDKINAVVKLEQ